jgi:hypothetical protein
MMITATAINSPLRPIIYGHSEIMSLTWGKQQNHSDNDQQRPHPEKVPCKLNEPRHLSVRLNEAKA